MGALKCANIWIEGKDKDLIAADIINFTNGSRDWKWTFKDNEDEFWINPDVADRICTAIESQTYGDREWFDLLGSYLETITAGKDIKMLCWWDCAEWRAAGYWTYGDGKFKWKTTDGMTTYKKVWRWIKKQTGWDIGEDD